MRSGLAGLRCDHLKKVEDSRAVVEQHEGLVIGPAGDGQRGAEDAKVREHYPCSAMCPHPSLHQLRKTGRTVVGNITNASPGADMARLLCLGARVVIGPKGAGDHGGAQGLLTGVKRRVRSGLTRCRAHRRAGRDCRVPRSYRS